MHSSSEIKSILVTGNLGYIGSVLTPKLAKLGYKVKGLDTEFYGDNCILHPYNKGTIVQITKDIRDVSEEDLEGIDAVIHLAALSNDPLGELNDKLTEEINYKATIRLAECAKKAKVKRFVYVSSQSIYGIADVNTEMDEDNSIKNPLTEYAKTKWMSECELKSMISGDFTIVYFRPSTVFGFSPRLRCDIVYNSLLGSAYTLGKIEIKSDGTPWRPIIHVNDVSNAFIASLVAPRELIQNQAFNIGIRNGNFTVRQLAETAKEVIPNASIVFTGEHGSDSRTYRVNFNKIYSKLNGYFNPEWDLFSGGNQMKDFFKLINFTQADFRSEKCNRILRIKKLMETKKIDNNLRWLE